MGGGRSARSQKGSEDGGGGVVCEQRMRGC